MISVQATITVVTALSVGFAVFRPYKEDVANHTGVTLSALLAVSAAIYMIFLIPGWKPAKVLMLVVIASIPHFVFYGCLMYRIRHCVLKRRLQEWCCCYRNAEKMALLCHDQ